MDCEPVPMIQEPIDAFRRDLPELLKTNPGKWAACHEAVSGIDLGGNAVVIVSGKILVYRTAAPNRFPRGALIRNVYRRNSSIVAPAFLPRRKFPSLKQLLAEIQRRLGRATRSTATKVTIAVEEDLDVERVKTAEGTRSLRLFQPDKLLDLC